MPVVQRICLFLLCFGTAQNLAAQAEDLTQDSTFFRMQVPIYQKWLDQAGLKSGNGSPSLLHTSRRSKGSI